MVRPREGQSYAGVNATNIEEILVVISNSVQIRLCAVRSTGPFSRAGAAGALRRAGTAVQSVGEADSVYYFSTTSSDMAPTCHGL